MATVFLIHFKVNILPMFKIIFNPVSATDEKQRCNTCNTFSLSKQQPFLLAPWPVTENILF